MTGLDPTNQPQRTLPRAKITAVIPLYNGAPFIAEAIESILAQSLPADEIIVVDDGSTDDGAEIVKRFLDRGPIKLLAKENGGQSSARNLGIRQAEGELIALLDQDDIWYENHLEVLTKPFMEARPGHHIGLVYGNLDRINRDGRMVRRNFLTESPSPHPKTWIAECVAADMFILPSASLGSKEAMIRTGLFDERLSGYEDDDLFSRMFSHGFELVYVPQPVTKWRIYNTSTSYTPRMARSRMIYFRKLVDTYPDEPDAEMYWVRDLIAPRFLGTLLQELVRATRASSKKALSVMTDIDVVLPHMRRKKRKRAVRHLSIARFMLNVDQPGAARAVVRRLIRHL
ncbi:MAG: glycosyltransferase family 2 protein [Rhizobiales bacterium]|nr:glycosyltransferase family 2 protein [Hyphomicrobiales bacterium]